MSDVHRRPGAAPQLPEHSQMILVDTCVLIDHLRGHEPARAWLSDMVACQGVQLAYSVITLAELMAGLTAGGDQASAIENLLSIMKPVSIDEAIAKRAASYMRQWRRSHGLAMADALIAATAEEVGATLATRDNSHFPMAALLVPYT